MRWHEAPTPEEIIDAWHFLAMRRDIPLGSKDAEIRKLIRAYGDDRARGAVAATAATAIALAT